MSTVDIDKLKSLSPAEKILLVQTLWDSLVDSGEPVELTNAQRDELDRRLERHRENPDAGSSWEEVKDRIKGQSELPSYCRQDEDVWRSRYQQGPRE